MSGNVPGPDRLGFLVGISRTAIRSGGAPVVFAAVQAFQKFKFRQVVVVAFRTFIAKYSFVVWVFGKPFDVA